MFTSYAQNFEDILFWRTLKHIENGFQLETLTGSYHAVEQTNRPISQQENSLTENRR